MATRSFTITMAPDEFTAIKAKLLANAAIKSHTENDSHSGTFTTSQVSMSYAYDGASVMTCTVLQKFGIARFASVDTIQEHVNELLAQE